MRSAASLPRVRIRRCTPASAEIARLACAERELLEICVLARPIVPCAPGGEVFGRKASSCTPGAAVAQKQARRLQCVRSSCTKCTDSTHFRCTLRRGHPAAPSAAAPTCCRCYSTLNNAERLSIYASTCWWQPPDDMLSLLSTHLLALLRPRRQRSCVS